MVSFFRHILEEIGVPIQGCHGKLVKPLEGDLHWDIDLALVDLGGGQVDVVAEGYGLLHVYRCHRLMA
jgi:hypothetical protein